jgi:uncharacterized protein (TIGR01777 family)
MRVFIAGGTGLIGRRIVRRLIARGDQAVVLSRRADAVRSVPELAGAELIPGDPLVPDAWEQAVDGCDAAINLVGHRVFAGRWSIEVKRLVRDSRVYGTGHLVAAIARAAKRPSVLVQASAVGYYGPHGDEELVEASPSGGDFMASVCKEWEAAAAPVAKLGVRLATIRTGVVLARGEGALAVMTPIFKFLPGGASAIGGGRNGLLPATGRQWVSWIHVDDIAALFLFALDRPDADGPFNGTAPHPARNAEFGRALAHALWRPFLPIGPPDSVVKLALGEVADMITKGQRVLPAKAQTLGFHFAYPDLKSALREIFTKSPRAAAKAR